MIWASCLQGCSSMCMCVHCNTSACYVGCVQCEYLPPCDALLIEHHFHKYNGVRLVWSVMLFITLCVHAEHPFWPRLQLYLRLPSFKFWSSRVTFSKVPMYVRTKSFHAHKRAYFFKGAANLHHSFFLMAAGPVLRPHGNESWGGAVQHVLCHVYGYVSCPLW